MGRLRSRQRKRAICPHGGADHQHDEQDEGEQRNASTRDNSPGRSASANATPKNATRTPLRRPGQRIGYGQQVSQHLEGGRDVRGMARNG